MHKFGMSFVRNFSSGKFGANIYSTSADGMTGAPPCSFGGVFLTAHVGNVGEMGVWGNLSTANNTGWGISMDDEWETLTNQIIAGQAGATSLDIGSGGTGNSISSGLSRALFVVYTVDAVDGPASIYFQGQLIATNQSPAPAASDDTVYLGYLPANISQAFSLGGVNMCFYTSNVLTEAEIRSMFGQLQYFGRLPQTIQQEQVVPQAPQWPAWQTDHGTPTTIDLDYVWQAYHLAGGSYVPPTEADGIPADETWTGSTWTSHGTTGLTPKVMTKIDTILPIMYMEYMPRVQWAGIIPHQTEPG